MSVAVSTRLVGDVIVVDVSGTITLGADADSFADAIHKLASNGHKKVLLNLSQLSYIDSCGIGEIVSSYTAISNQGGVMQLLMKLPTRVQTLLHITKVDTVLKIHRDETTAVDSFREPDK